ncbi:hypothetical protein GYM75_12090 [Gilliamella sp. ESL0441]|uniref:hypothetical protein n=1 Tax=Gilliamella sp. ESL0441 TaxID=2704654 RepID=UPI001C69B3C9|nr:hypothetical protein [Gilliamella sp. ESL0441]QYN45519.1 hypothetical protein GYM75_12090 [Gilliamella sp. ESL0441]
MKINKKYKALLFVCTVMSVSLFLFVVIISLIFSYITYLQTKEFIIDVNDIYNACKLAPLGILTGVGMWYLECRRLGVKIFGK